MHFHECMLPKEEYYASVCVLLVPMAGRRVGGLYLAAATTVQCIANVGLAQISILSFEPIMATHIPKHRVHYSGVASEGLPLPVNKHGAVTSPAIALPSRGH